MTHKQYLIVTIDIVFKKEAEIDLFFVDFVVEELNLAIECLGPAHYTVFRKKTKGQTELRMNILKKMGKNTLVINYEEWLMWKTENTVDSSLLKSIKTNS